MKAATTTKPLSGSWASTTAASWTLICFLIDRRLQLCTAARQRKLRGQTAPCWTRGGRTSWRAIKSTVNITVQHLPARLCALSHARLWISAWHRDHQNERRCCVANLSGLLFCVFSYFLLCPAQGPPRPESACLGQIASAFAGLGKLFCMVGGWLGWAGGWGWD